MNTRGLLQIASLAGILGGCAATRASGLNSRGTITRDGTTACPAGSPLPERTMTFFAIPTNLHPDIFVNYARRIREDQAARNASHILVSEHVPIAFQRALCGENTRDCIPLEGTIRNIGHRDDVVMVISDADQAVNLVDVNAICAAHVSVQTVYFNGYFRTSR